MTTQPPRKKQNQFVEIAKQVSDMDKKSANKQQQGENPGGGTGTGPQQQGGTAAGQQQGSLNFESEPSTPPRVNPVYTDNFGGSSY